MKFQTPVEVGRSPFRLSLKDDIVILGSCFADGIGERLVQHGFRACVNPFGPLYNPESILQAVERLCCATPFDEADCVEMGAGAGLICSFSHHTKAARKSAGEFLDSANESLKKACAAWEKANSVIITLGSSFAYRHKESGRIVSNCLKRPAGEFERVFVPCERTEEILLDGLCRRFPDKRFIFTVSPVRHLSDGAAANSVSKSSLLMAASFACGSSSVNSVYFPSFEIMMDELRDYRFYAEDMVHPSSQAVDYIWERFCEFALDKSEKEAMEEAFRNYRRSLHRDILDSVR